MQDLKLKGLVDEVNRCNTNFNHADEATVNITIYELGAAEGRLNLYIEERKNERTLDKVN